MSGSLNRATVLGNLGRDAEVRATQDGSNFMTFSLATTEGWTDKNTGEVKERTDWHNIVVFGDALIGAISKYLVKGTKVYVEGRLATRKWQAQDGSDRWSTEIVVQNFGGQIVLCGGGQRRPDPTPDAYQSASPPPSASTSQKAMAAAKPPLPDDEVPF